MRVSYSGYYTSLPRMRRQFDSAYPLQDLEIPDFSRSFKLCQKENDREKSGKTNFF